MSPLYFIEVTLFLVSEVIGYHTGDGSLFWGVGGQIFSVN